MTTVVGDGSPLDLLTDVRSEVVEAKPGATYEWTLDTAWSGVLYVADGTVELPEGAAESGSFAARHGLDDGDRRSVEVTAQVPATFAAIGGRALGEPIRQRDPVVL